MKTFSVKVAFLMLILVSLISEVAAHDAYVIPSYGYNYGYTRVARPTYTRPVVKNRFVTAQQPLYINSQQNLVVCPNLSSVSVGAGNTTYGVNISIVSDNATLQNCIKNTSWLSYFTQFGNSVTVAVTNTTLGVQILATSYDTTVISNLQNARWSTIITGISYESNNSSYYNNYSNGNYYNNNYYQPTPPPPPYYNNYNNNYYNNNYTIPYRTGTDVFSGNTRYMIRSLSNVIGGVQMSFTSPDYNTTLYLQRFAFSDIFSSRLS